ncbi:MAG: RidA family protein [Chloroflexi bacterium]|nr:RidA family protein [Chloroflexota bacterium]MCI0575984.1 RidA family protein [Chloroflexota bacterium]MCI0648234.1 RidA family protein [Chloroflexota bacterium]MCI0725194.1 RidA family protein [Chloroflexota bacterium]
MQKEIIATPNAPVALGPYSQAVRVGKFIYTAGQLARDPASGSLVIGDVAAQTEQVIGNLQAVLEAAGSGLDHVVKTTVFLQDLAHFKTMNEVYGRFFSQSPPARTTIQAAALPLDALVVIEAVALYPEQ